MGFVSADFEVVQCPPCRSEKLHDAVSRLGYAFANPVDAGANHAKQKIRTTFCFAKFMDFPLLEGSSKNEKAGGFKVDVFW